MRMMAKASPNGTFVRVASVSAGRPAGPKPLSSAWMVTACSRLAVTSVHQSCQAMKRKSRRPRVMNTSPRVRTPERTHLIAVPSSQDLRVRQTQASRVCRESHLVIALNVVAQPVVVHILPIDLDLLVLVERRTHRGRVPDRLA